MLGELADLAMDLARDMAAKAKKSESLEDAERYTLAFDRMARSVRLSIALSRRLERDHLRDQSHRQSEVVDLRKSRLRARLRSEIAEADVSFKRSLELERELDATLAEDALYQSFVDLPLDEAIYSLRDRLGLIDPPPGRSPIEGEVDRDACRETEGAQAHSHLSGFQPPHPTTSGAPPEGEHLGISRPAPA
jgi:hypothetical protein